MSNVVIILNTIILLVIVIYLITTRESGTPPQMDDSISTKDEATTETESGDSETESDDSETEPEPEDPGTCEITGTWAMVGTCNADGTAKYTQTYKESKPGACPSSVKADFKPCCYQKGDWKDITECKPSGKKTQKQTTINCAENFKTREVECPYEGAWKKTGGCTSEGKQYYTRFTINSDATTTTTEDCCYKSPWGGWGNWGACDGSKRYRTRNRTVINCPQETATTDTGSQNCNHCAGYWEKNIKCWKTGNVVWGIQQYSKHTYDKYVRTKNASNGGDDSCPSNETRANWKTLVGSGKHGHQC